MNKNNIEEKNISEELIKRENTIISILINEPELYKIIKENISVNDFRYDLNKKIIDELYKELEKEEYNISFVLDHLEDENIQNHLTAIMAEDYGIVDNKKALNDIFTKYQREKLEKRRDEILAEEIKEVDLEKKKQLSKELNDIILKLVKIK